MKAPKGHNSHFKVIDELHKKMKAPKPPKGFRLLRKGEKIRDGDVWRTAYSPPGEWLATVLAGTRSRVGSNSDWIYHARKKGKK